MNYSCSNSKSWCLKIRNPLISSFFLFIYRATNFLHKINLNQMSNHSFFFFVSLFFFSVADGVHLIIVNNCKQSIWPGILGNAGHPIPRDGGFHLPSGEQTLLKMPKRWSGRVWPRQGCYFDSKTGRGSCQTGDCAGLLHCRGTAGVPPATVVEMTLGTSKSPIHYYDVSLVDGFNIPVTMVPIGGGVECEVAACAADLNRCCPSALEVKRDGEIVGCKSGCLAVKSDEYCCRGEFADPKICKPSIYGHLFKAICPMAYSYAYDESTGLKMCRAPRYVITFCPPSSI